MSRNGDNGDNLRLLVRKLDPIRDNREDRSNLMVGAMEAKGTRLVKRENGIFYIVWTGNSRGKTTKTKDLRVAELALADCILRRQRGEDGVQNGLTVHKALRDYLVEHVRSKVASVGIAEFSARYLCAHFSHRIRVADLTQEDIDAYARKRYAGRIVLKAENPKPASTGTVRRELGVLVAALSHAVRRKRISREDVPRFELPPDSLPRVRWLTLEEEQQLVAACTVERNGRLTRIYRFLILALETAGRKEALETLRWFQVDFQLGRIDLNPVGRSQTNKRRPVVRMSERLRAVLERAYREKTSSYVLDHPGNGREAFDRIVITSKLENVTPHTLRHTWATRAARAGVSMRQIADWLGDNIATVERNYYHHSPDYLQEATDWREREPK